ncbi:fructosamine kinase family protein [Puniceicoccaceae bacterium K14]|nr:fructosamine kinase family protein [Puniceicoccaceae bacterium K14]
MDTWELIEHSLSNTINSPVSIFSKRSMPGGCINEAYSIKIDNGQQFFVKTNSSQFFPQFETEALALNEIVNTKTLHAPRPICHGANNAISFLILEYIQAGQPREASWSDLGKGLAAMHASISTSFGWHCDNVIGATPQPNPQTKEWIDFFRIHRLGHQFRLCSEKGLTIKNSDTLLSNLPSFFIGHSPQPSLLHGDLWSGNTGFDNTGSPFIFDPCCYYGDREADLAFTEFFGGFHREFYISYQDAWPLNEGYIIRKHLYNNKGFFEQ